MDKIIFREKLKMLQELQNVADIDGLTAYAEYLLEENEKLNLTAITAEEEVAVKHIADSLSGMHMIPEGASVMDVGTGAGLPGMVLAIARPDLTVTLNDSIRKKCDFLARAVEKLGLKNVKVVCERAEALGTSAEHREKYDIVVSRAVARLNMLAEFCLPLVRVGGKFIAYKAAIAKEELDEARHGIGMLGGTPEAPKAFLLAGEYERTLIPIKKVRNTPKEFPRPTKDIKNKAL